MISRAESLDVLALCTARPGDAAIGDSLRVACAKVRDWDGLAADAEAHGLEPLLAAHLRQHDVAPPPGVAARLKVRCVQHAHAAAVRRRVLADVLDALDDQRTPVMVLKGAALAHLVYPSPSLRPMRDVDLLVPAQAAQRAWRALGDLGFAPIGIHPGPGHHHLPALAAFADGATITVEVHSDALAVAPFVRRLRYDDLAERSQAFWWGARAARTLGREDMLWHVYAHAFLVEVLRPQTRLIAVADLVAAVEAWEAVVDWDRLGRTYPRLIRALAAVGQRVPWSPRVQGRLGPASRARQHRAAWAFDVRYGSDTVPRRAWNRVATHPASLGLAALQMTRLKLRRRLA